MAAGAGLDSMKLPWHRTCKLCAWEHVLLRRPLALALSTQSAGEAWVGSCWGELLHTPGLSAPLDQELRLWSVISAARRIIRCRLGAASAVSSWDDLLVGKTHSFHHVSVGT